MGVNTRGSSYTSYCGNEDIVVVVRGGGVAEVEAERGVYAADAGPERRTGISPATSTTAATRLRGLNPANLEACSVPSS